MCQSLYFNKVAGLTCNFIKIETLAQVFSCEFSKISKNNIFTEYVWATASITHTQDEYILIVFFYFQVASNCANSSKQEVKHSHYNLSIKGEKYQLDLSKLLMLWSDCFLSQSKYFDQLPHRKTKQKQKQEKVCRSNWKITKNRGILKHIWWEVI